jgi:hypothetical protein
MIVKYDSKFFDQFVDIIEHDNIWKYGELHNENMSRLISEYIEKKRNNYYRCI